ncbi:high-affinity nitrate transporter 3.1-like [Andrographis paniculata]|uniref:high-affinity nitrate transporter 3.1-like n=1 Tax=Andrographis paniculata TaxID=175694 RepID=UPI0021E82906|nr:high-affinity nitrate transporter 3.1-like [Andrographis paniculata]
MANSDFSLAAALILSCLAGAATAATFSSLREAFVVTASPLPGQVLKAGEDNITVTWRLSSAVPGGAAAAYRTVDVKLCYAPVSQRDRAWRKTADNLEKDKTCQHTIVARRPYISSAGGAASTATAAVQKDVPTATYFVRAYAYDSGGEAVAYGQTTDGPKTAGLFHVEGVSGRHVSLEIASACFSAFSLLSLLAFFYIEKRKSK